LKCDATPRQVCNETRNTSASDATAKSPTTIQPVTRLVRMNVISHATVTSVMPNDSPNTIGLRHDSGPSHGPPSTT
jgi:hypothetical protein